MRSIKITGLLIFIMGFVIFNGSFFLSRYQLTTGIIDNHIQDPQKAALLKEELGRVFNQKYSSVFAFVSALDSAFIEANEKQYSRYGISDQEIDRIVSLNRETFSISSIDSVFSREEESAIQFKRKSFQDYGSWLDKQKIASPAELKSQLGGIRENIKKYAITSTYGFDRYAIKDLKYSLAKSASLTPLKTHPLIYFFLTIGLCVAGAMLYILPKVKSPSGIKNNGVFFNVMKNGSWLGMATGTWLIGFYIVLYFYPEYMTQWVLLVDPLSNFLNGHEAGRFFLYGFMYTLAILVMGVRMMIHYRHSNYHLVRTISVMFFQTAFAFLIPELLIRLNRPYYDFKNIWPLDYSFFFDTRIDALLSSGGLGLFMLVWGIILIIIAVPVLVYFFGKRWYCSWVCGCGGLAETLGDPYRQLSNKTVRAWKIERWTVHGVLVFAIVMTIGVLYTYFTNDSWFLFFDTYKLREVYGAFIGAGFAGVVGTGFYPLMGNRVWCRFGCPLAAYLGLVQRFKSRFRITTNGGQCISCGNCSTYCEMGIDVRWYAQRGQNIVRSSCVGCGVCSSVCPRGVLNLEIKKESGRFGNPILIGNNNVKIEA